MSTLLFAICIVVFVLAERQGSTQTNETLIRFGANYRPGVWHGEWWRLFTSMFLHIGVVHLVWNLWAGFSWTAPFERVVGTWRFLVIYLLSGLVGSAVSIIGHDVVSAGASGALFGVMGGSLVLMRARMGGWRALWNEPGPQRMILTTIMWLAIGPFVGFDSFAHAGGMAAGMALTSGFLPRGQYRLAFAAFACAVVIACATRPLPVLHDGWIDVQALDAAWRRHDWREVTKLTERVKPGDRLAPFRAEALLSEGRPAEAAALLPATVEKPDDAPWVASLLRRAGQVERAKKVLENAIDAAPGDLELEWALYTFASDEHDHPLLDKATTLLVRDHVGTWQGKTAKGIKLLREGEREEGFDLLSAAAEVDPRARGHYVLELVNAGRRADARAAIKGSDVEAWLTCWVLSVDGEFDANREACESLDDSDSSRQAKAYWLVGRGDCAGGLALIADSASIVGRTLKVVCSLREHAETAEQLASARANVRPGDPIEARLLIFSQSHDLADLGGAEREAKDSWLWPLLSDEAKRVLPR